MLLMLGFGLLPRSCDAVAVYGAVYGAVAVAAVAVAPQDGRGLGAGSEAAAQPLAAHPVADPVPVTTVPRKLPVEGRPLLELLRESLCKHHDR